MERRRRQKSWGGDGSATVLSLGLLLLGGRSVDTIDPASQVHYNLNALSSVPVLVLHSTQPSFAHARSCASVHIL